MATGPTREEKVAQAKREIIELNKRIKKDGDAAALQDITRLEAMQELVRLHEQSANYLQTELGKAIKLEKAYADLEVTAESRAALQSQSLHTMQIEKRLIEERIKDENEMVRLADLKNITVEKMRQLELERITTLQTNIEHQQIQLDLADKTSASYKDGVGALTDMGKQFAGIFSTANSAKAQGVIGGFVKLAENMRTLSSSVAGVMMRTRELALESGEAVSAWKLLGTGIQAAAKAMGPMVFLAPFTLLLGEVWALVEGVDSMEKSFRKGTLASKELAGEMSANYQDMMSFGLSAEQAERSASALFKTYTDFTMLTAAERTNVRDLVTTLELVGVTGDTTAKALQTATKSFGMGVPQATRAIHQLEGFARSAQLDFEGLVTEFSEAGPALAKFADQGQTFMELQRVMKITGMEMQDILRITDKFDTFEGAAEQAGKLNAALGGNFVNAMDLMMATDPVERFGMIRDSILNAGLSFDDMSYYQRKYFAEAAGLENVADLSKLLSGDFDALGGATEEQVTSLADLKQMGYEMIPILEQFGIAFKEIFAEVDVDQIKDFLNDFTSSLKEMPEMVDKVRQGLALLAAIGVTIAIMLIIPVSGFVATVGVGIAAVAAGILAFKTAIGTLMGTATKKKSPSFITMWEYITDKMGLLKKGITALLSPFTLLQKGIQGVGKAFTEKHSPSFLDALNQTVTMGDGAANSIGKIGKAMNAIPTQKNVEFAASMTAATEVAATSQQMGTATTGNRVVGMAAGGRRASGKMEQRTYNINVIDKNGSVTDKHILKVIGRDIEATLRQQR